MSNPGHNANRSFKKAQKNFSNIKPKSWLIIIEYELSAIRFIILDLPIVSFNNELTLTQKTIGSDETIYTKPAFVLQKSLDDGVKLYVPL